MPGRRVSHSHCCTAIGQFIQSPSRSQIRDPAERGRVDHAVDVFERRSLLAVGIGNIAAIGPLVQKQGTPHGVRRAAHDDVDMRALHGQDEVGITDHALVELTRYVVAAVQTVLLDQAARGVVHALACQGTDSGGSHVEVRQIMTKQQLGGGAAADIADADDQDPLKHLVSSLAVVHPRKQARGDTCPSAPVAASTERCGPSPQGRHRANINRGGGTGQEKPMLPATLNRGHTPSPLVGGQCLGRTATLPSRTTRRGGNVAHRQEAPRHPTPATDVSPSGMHGMASCTARNQTY